MRCAHATRYSSKQVSGDVRKLQHSTSDAGANKTKTKQDKLQPVYLNQKAVCEPWPPASSPVKPHNNHFVFQFSWAISLFSQALFSGFSIPSKVFNELNIHSMGVPVSGKIR